MNVLFICNQGKNRSRTAATLFRGRFQTQSAGLYCENSVTKHQLMWADVIIVMEDRHRTEIAQRFPMAYMQKRILVMEIPDLYRHGQSELVHLLKARIADLL